MRKVMMMTLACSLVLGLAAADAEARRKKKKKDGRQLPPPATWSPTPVMPIQRAPNSLWASTTVSWTDDLRAREVNDILQVRITERSVAKSLVKTKTKREADQGFQVPNFLGLVESLASGDLDPSNLVNASSESEFTGDGSTQREESLATTVTGRVVQVLPNGNLHFEAAREVTINNERQYLLVAGVVRPRDVAMNNSVVSTDVADLRIVFAGAGDLSKVQKKGWFQKALEWILPW